VCKCALVFKYVYFIIMPLIFVANIAFVFWEFYFSLSLFASALAFLYTTRCPL